MTKRPPSPEFPAYPVRLNHSVYAGMSQRTYIATQAMAGLLTKANLGSEYFDEEAIACGAVAVADALIAELNK